MKMGIYDYLTNRINLDELLIICGGLWMNSACQQENQN